MNLLRKLFGGGSTAPAKPIGKYVGGCDHISTVSNADPIDNHVCHCNVCKSVTSQQTTHVVFFKHGDLSVSNEANLNRQPFNAENPDGPLDLCTCKDCGTPIMLDDKQKRIRATVPNLMGQDASTLAATYHAFWDESKGYDKPSDGRPVYDSLRPEFVWPAGVGDSASKDGGCDHIKTSLSGAPIDNHECHCNVCKSVTSQHTTHVVFYNHADVQLSNEANVNRQPFNADNPDGPLELCTCKDCGTPIMLDDKQKRIRVLVPNLMGFDGKIDTASYHAFWDETKGYDKPNDGRPVYDGLRPEFVWPLGA